MFNVQCATHINNYKIPRFPIEYQMLIRKFKLLFTIQIYLKTDIDSVIQLYFNMKQFFTFPEMTAEILIFKMNV